MRHTLLDVWLCLFSLLELEAFEFTIKHQYCIPQDTSAIAQSRRRIKLHASWVVLQTCKASDYQRVLKVRLDLVCEHAI